MFTTNVSMESWNVTYRWTFLSSSESFCWQVNLQHALSWHIELLTTWPQESHFGGCFCAVLLNFFLQLQHFLKRENSSMLLIEGTLIVVLLLKRSSNSPEISTRFDRAWSSCLATVVSFVVLSITSPSGTLKKKKNLLGMGFWISSKKKEKHLLSKRIQQL